MSESKSVVLLSSGLDSTFNLYRAEDVILALTFDYGQRAAGRETEKSAEHCKRLGVPHKVIRLPWFSDFTASSLVNRSAQVPTGSAVAIRDERQSQSTAKAVWVPNRNGIFLEIAAGFAEGLGASRVIVGFNREEAQTFPDNSKDYLLALNGALIFSTQNRVRIASFSTEMDKAEIVKECRTLGVPLELVWPCYFGDDKPCGECESCQRFKHALSANKMNWPWR